MPRGETHVLQLVTIMLQNKAKAVQYTDNLPVYNIYNKGVAFALASANKDLWEQIFQNVECKELDLSVKWLPSHLKDGQKKLKKPKSLPTPEWVTDWHIRGNSLADGLASEAAQMCQLEGEIARPVLWNIDLASKIQKRLTSIVCSSRRENTPQSRNSPSPNNCPEWNWSANRSTSFS